MIKSFLQIFRVILEVAFRTLFTLYLQLTTVTKLGASEKAQITSQSKSGVDR